MQVKLLTLFSSAICAITLFRPLHSVRYGDQGLDASKEGASRNIQPRTCGTVHPSGYLLAAHRDLKSTRLNARASLKPNRITVNVYFHIISTQDQSEVVQPSMVANQFGILQQAYAASNISFNLAGIDYTINDTWATDQADADMKYALRQGNYSALNVYFQTNLSTSLYGAQTHLLGYCTLPTNVTYSPCAGCPLLEFPAIDYALDGCNVLAGSMPGGAVIGYNSGKTAIHEIGHWFGLLHTFQDTTCTPGDPGDYIDDTPQESVSTAGCPEGKDSCPNCPGLDPIHNFMDYSTDACYESFSPQQMERMQSMYRSLRLGN